MDKPQIKLTTTPSKVVNGENVIGTAQYHYPTSTPPGMSRPPGMTARPGMSPPPGIPAPLPGPPSGMPPPPMESTENYTVPPGMTLPPGNNKPPIPYGNPANPKKVGGCKGTRYGCCSDGVTAKNKSGSNCPKMN